MVVKYPHQLHTILSSAQEAVVVALRKTLLLPLNDLLAVTREFIFETNLVAVPAIN